MKHWADKVDWWRTLGALTALVGSVGFLHERVVRLEANRDSSSAETAQLRLDLRELRAELKDCGRHG